MRIWIVNHYSVPPSETGVTRHYSLARELTKRGHEVHIVSSNFNHWTKQDIHSEMSSNCKKEVIDGVNFIWIATPPYQANSPARMWNMLVFTLKTRWGKALKNLKSPDVIIGSSPHPFSAWAAERLANDYRVPFIMEVRDLWPRTLVDLGKFSSRHPFIIILTQLERYLYNKAALIITPLPGAIHYISGLGIPPARVVWIPNGIDLKLVPELKPPQDNARLNVVYAGAHGLANGLDNILECAGILMEQGWSNRLLFRFIGDGPEKNRLKALANNKGLENIRFEDPVPKKMIYDKLQEADILLVVLRKTKLYQWGLSLNKLFDYMSVARPIVFAVDAFNDPVKESGGGISVPPENPAALAQAIQQIVAMSTSQRYEMGLKGRRYVEENHDYINLTEKLEQVINGVVIAGSCKRGGLG